ncbi:MBL fold metallo-hydrolase [Streptomyces bacillaris]|uniref:MBL fold metallo-hydrolase n=1 Tax=Streptomyces bacillaris TaxID=68179 RepID=UPI003461066F
MALYRGHRGDRPVTALIYTHSHGDHFGGARSPAPGHGGGRSVPRPHGLPGVRRQRERLRGQRHAPAGDVHVRRQPGEGPRRPDRRRARHDDVHRDADADPAHGGHHAHGPSGTWSAWAGPTPWWRRRARTRRRAICGSPRSC